MKVCAGDPAANDAIGCSVLLPDKRIDRFDRLGSAHVDLVSGNGSAKERAALRLNRHLVAAQVGFRRQQMKAFQASQLFDTKGVGYLSSEHLISTADAEHPSATFQRLEQQRLEASFVKPLQVADRIFCSGDDQKVNGGCGFSQIFHCDIGDRFERIEVRVIGNVRQSDSPHAKLSMMYQPLVERDAVLLGDTEMLDVRQLAETGAPGVLFQQLRPSVEQAQVASKTIDDESPNEVALVAFQKSKRADNRGEYSSPIDVGHQHSAAADGFRKRQIDDIAIFEVQLHGTSGALD